MFSDTNNFEIQTFIFMDFETTDLFDDNPIDPLLNPNRCSESAKACSQRLENLLCSGNIFVKMSENFIKLKMVISCQKSLKWPL